MTYAEHIEINKNFQKSINLELDLGNEKKIAEYIPTPDICNIIKLYVQVCLGYSKSHAVNFFGPYGKGKSFLLLVLSYLTGKNKKDDVYDGLLEKIRAVDEELYQDILKMDEQNIQLLPVIVNSNYNNIEQAFLLALSEAMQRADIDEIIPVTVYDTCLNIINDWKNNGEACGILSKYCVDTWHIGVTRLENDLRDYNPDAYRKFRKLHKYMTKGVDFNPLVTDDIVKIYNNVNYQLIDKGYSGMFIVFDEFSKFLDSSSSTMGQDLKVIQSLAELANRSGSDNPMIFWTVTHKSLGLYKSVDKNLFKTVEGRFTEVRFTNSISDNYQIIAAAIKQDPNWRVPEEYIKQNSDFYNGIRKTRSYWKAPDVQKLFKSIFPLNPMTIVALIQMSEKVAQNERTLFTFLSDTDDNSFNNFIHTHDTGLFNVDKIYDYFLNGMRNLEDKNIRGIVYQTESVLNNISDQDERAIVKALSVILIINDFKLLAPNAETLCLAVDLDKNLTESKIQTMIDDHFLRRNVINNMISFASANSEEIDKKIEIEMQMWKKQFSLADTLNKINEIRYLLPRRYNEQNKISRFFKVVYMTEDTFAKLTSFDLLFENQVCDGIVINLLRKEMTTGEIKDKTAEVNDKRVIVRYPEKSIDDYFEELALRYSSLAAIIQKGGNDKIVTDEMEQLLSEMKDDMTALMEHYFNEESYSVYLGKTRKDFNKLLSDTMDATFKKHIIFNNELVNKTNVTTQYQKAVNHVVDWILNGKGSFGYSDTSPEKTICRSVIDKIDVQDDAREIVNGVKTSIIESENEKCPVADIVKRYSIAPYGVRRGVMPLLFAQAISELSDNVLLYLHGKEIDVNAENITKAVNSKGGYSFGFAKGSKAQSEYVLNMLKVLGQKPTNIFRKDIKTLCDEFRRFFVGLPMIIRSASNGSNFDINDAVLAYKNCFMSYNLNPFEVVCQKPLEIFKTNSYDEAYQTLSTFISSWHRILLNFKKNLVKKAKDVLDIQGDSIRMGLESFIKKQIPEGTTIILDDNNETLLNAISMLSYEDIEAINTIAKILLGSYIEDWNADRSEELLNALAAFKEKVLGAERRGIRSLDEIVADTSEDNTSAMGQMLYENIQTLFNEFGGSVSNDEKVSILSRMIRQFM
jgi:hypothetical protein